MESTVFPCKILIFHQKTKTPKTKTKMVEGGSFSLKMF